MSTPVIEQTKVQRTIAAYRKLNLPIVGRPFDQLLVGLFSALLWVMVVVVIKEFFGREWLATVMIAGYVAVPVIVEFGFKRIRLLIGSVVVGMVCVIAVVVVFPSDGRTTPFNIIDMAMIGLILEGMTYGIVQWARREIFYWKDDSFKIEHITYGALGALDVVWLGGMIIMLIGMYVG